MEWWSCFHPDRKEIFPAIEQESEDFQGYGSDLLAKVGAEVPKDALPFQDEEPSPAVPKIAADKPGRNDPCPCRSGKKYKKCCGKAG
jgi:uncharacterized protein YecA (UPF0149 family)